MSRQYRRDIHSSVRFIQRISPEPENAIAITIKNYSGKIIVRFSFRAL